MQQQEKQIELVNKLHRRHTAKLLDALNEIRAHQVIISAVKTQFSFYTNDIKNQVLASNQSHNDQSKSA